VREMGGARRRPARLRGGRRRPGFALLLVFLMAAFVAIALYRELPRVAFEAQRAKEQLLIDRGEQYKRAIQLFVRQNNGRYPATLDDLENFNNRRYLRRRYKDPMTGSDEWRLVHIGPGGMLTDSKTQKAPQAPGQGDNNFGTPVEEIAGQQSLAPDQQQQSAPWARMRRSDFRPTPFPPQGQPQPGAYGDEPPAGQAQYPDQPQNPDGDNADETQQPVPGGAYYPGAQPVAGQPYAPAQPYVPGQNMPPSGIPGVPGQASVIVQRPALPWQRGSGAVVTPVPVPFQNPVQYPQQSPQPAPYGAGTQFGQALGDSAYGAPQGVPAAPPNAPGMYPNQQNPPANSPFPGVPAAVANQLFNPAANQGAPGTQGFAGPPAGSGAAGGVFGQSNNNFGGGGIAGVASKLEQKSIMRYDNRTQYDEWEFVYDPRKDKTGMMLPGAGVPNQPGQFGQPAGGQAGQSGQFGLPAQPMYPSLGPGTPNQ